MKQLFTPTHKSFGDTQSHTPNGDTRSFNIIKQKKFGLTQPRSICNGSIMHTSHCYDKALTNIYVM